jgi:hypothetical protein
MVNPPPIRIRSANLITSIALADVIAGAVGITKQSAQLHLKTIRAAGAITFKGYGRAAAAMTSLDASRLLIAVAGSSFAKDSLEVLRRFANLEPLGDKGPKLTLEQFLARRIEALPQERSFEGDRSELRRPFGSRRLSKIAFELMWAAGVDCNELPPFAVVRWLSANGDSHTLTFGPQRERRGSERRRPDGDIDDRYDLLEVYPEARMFQTRIVTREALIDIAEALNQRQSLQ